jgi:methanogenic corrinoid protein MtbC1
MPGIWKISLFQKEKRCTMSQELIDAITEMREDDALAITNKMLSEGTDPLDVLEACRNAMEVIGNRFEDWRLLHPGADFGRRNAE